MNPQDENSRERMKELRRARREQNYRECIVWVPEEDFSTVRDLAETLRDACPRPFQTQRPRK